MSSLCTALRITKCSHRFTMLRFRSLAWHKNNLIIYDFFGRQSSDEFFLHECVGLQNAHIRQSMLRFRSLAWHKNNLIIYDFFCGKYLKIR